MNEFDDKLIEVIEQNGMLELGEIERAKKMCVEQGKNLEAILTGGEMLNAEQILWVKSQIWQVPLIRIDPDAIDRELLATFPSSLLWEGEVIPLLKFEDEINVAMTDPTRKDVIADLEKVSGCKVQVSLARPDHVKNVLEGLVDSKREQPDETSKITIDPTAFGTDDESGVATIFYNLMQAVQKNATEALFRTSDQGVNIHFRIGRELVFSETAPPERAGSIMSKLEVMSNLDSSKGDLLDTQTMTLELFGQKYHLDFVRLPSPGEKAIRVAIRPFQPASPKQFPKLNSEDAAWIQSMMQARSGLFMVNSSDRELAGAALNHLLSLAENEIVTLLVGDDDLVDATGVVAVPPEKLNSAGSGSLDFVFDKINPDVAILDYAAIADAAIPISWVLSNRLLILLMPYDCAATGLAKLMETTGDGAALAAGFAGSLASKTFLKLDEANRSPVVPTEKESAYIKSLGAKAESANYYAVSGLNPSAESVTFYELIPPDETVLEFLRDAPPPGKLFSLLHQNGYRKILTNAASAAGEGIISLHDLLRY